MNKQGDSFVQANNGGNGAATLQPTSIKKMKMEILPCKFIRAFADAHSMSVPYLKVFYHFKDAAKRPSGPKRRGVFHLERQRLWILGDSSGGAE